MAKTQRLGEVSRRGGARRVAKGRLALVRPTRRRVQVSLGELIAAAYDVTGGETQTVAALMASRAMARATGRRLVVAR